MRLPCACRFRQKAYTRKWVREALWRRLPVVLVQPFTVLNSEFAFRFGIVACRAYALARTPYSHQDNASRIGKQIPLSRYDISIGWGPGMESV
jgi:hypothetical protein